MSEFSDAGFFDVKRQWHLSHGGSVPAGGGPAFALAMPCLPALPILLAVPHAGRHYPPSLTAQMRHPELAQLRLEDRYVDILAQAIALETGAALLVAHAPRAMIDLNRAPGDVDWSMIEGGAEENGPSGSTGSPGNRRWRAGLGLVPRRLAGSGEIWRGSLPLAELHARIENVHRPYHIALGQALEDIRDQWGAALLIDLHSMPPLKNRHAGEGPAQFVIGDRFAASSDGMLPARALRYFGAHERPTAHNRPYAGGYVLDRHASPARGIHAMQLEICRGTYLDKRFDKLSARAASVAKLLAGLVRELADETAVISHHRQRPIAAE